MIYVTRVFSNISVAVATIFITLGFISLATVTAADDNLLVGADAGYGEYLSGECVACHHSQGESKGIPSITGWDPETFVIVMRAYRDKEIDHNVMQMVSGRLDDEQIASLAVYFSTLPSAE